MEYINVTDAVVNKVLDDMQNNSALENFDRESAKPMVRMICAVVYSLHANPDSDVAPL